MIKRLFKVLDKESLLIIYRGYVRPHLECAMQAWSPFLQKDIDRLEKVQKGNQDGAGTQQAKVLGQAQGPRPALTSKTPTQG